MDLNDLLLSNYDQWHISNAAIVFDDPNLQMNYLEKATQLKQYKKELDRASNTSTNFNIKALDRLQPIVSNNEYLHDRGTMLASVTKRRLQIKKPKRFSFRLF